MNSICEGCQTPLTPAAKFCSECGRAVGAAAPAPQVQVTQTVQDLPGTMIGVKVEQYVDKPPDELLRAYYRSLAGDCSRLPLGVIYLRFTEANDPVDLLLPRVYIDLEAYAPPPPVEGEQPRSWEQRLEQMGEGKDRVALLEKLPEASYRRIVLLGEAGSGKTTFVNYLAYLLAGGFVGEVDASALLGALRGRLVVRLALRDAAALCAANAAPPCGAQLLWDTLQADLSARLGQAAAARLAPYLQERLCAQGGVVLLDGLDEVPEANNARAALLRAVDDFTRQLAASSRIVVTARPYAYHDPAWRLERFATLWVAEFDAAQIERFIQRWYQALGPEKGWRDADIQARAGSLQFALEQRPYLADLARRPLLLTLMASLHSGEGRLPEDRAELYEQTVNLLLSRWQRNRLRAAPGGQTLEEPGILQVMGVGEDRLRSALEELAFDAHQRQAQQGEQRDAGVADISRGDVLQAFEPLLGQLAPADLLAYLQDRAGLIAARSPGIYAFPHRSFQEYLAACFLANRSDFFQRLGELVYQDATWWREVFLLAAGRARRGGLSSAAALVKWLLPDFQPGKDLPENRWRGLVLAAQAALELRLAENAAGQQYYLDLLECARRWLAALLENGRLSPAERHEAGNALSRLGDPRRGVGLLRAASDDELGPIPDIDWLHVPAGSFRMGSPDDFEQAYADERPQHTLHLPGFYIARYPITNAQYRPFVEGGGYAARRYWTDAGWAWRGGEDSDLALIEDQDFRQRYQQWLESRPAERRDRPYWWEHPQLGAANRPVVGVCWYEALAYCAWLTEKLLAFSVQQPANAGLSQDERAFWQAWAQGRRRVSLPSEAEWEKAASWAGGRQRVYPWGDEFDAGRANTREAGLGETCAVGLFPGGASPYGLLDMSGNAWQWTRSRWGRRSFSQPDYRYPYHPDDGREDLAGPDWRIVRGGSWNDDLRLARCAYRNRDAPDNFDVNLGVRVFSPDSES